MQDVARAHSVKLIPCSASLESHNAGEVLGAGQFFDHVHPTINGNRLLGRLLVDELIEMQVVKQSAP
jgi:hypothetical protein